MQTITARAIILALKPLLANTPISPSEQGVSWDLVWQKKTERERITAYLKSLEPRIAWVVCPACKSQWNNLTPDGICIACSDKRLAAEMQQVRLGDLLLKSIGRYGLETYTFDKFRESADNMAAYHACLGFNPEHDNLYLWGACGVGKTHLAGSVLKASAAAGRAIKWANSLYLTRSLRGRFPADEEAFIEELVWKEVLIIDDLGLAKDADTLLRLVYELAEKRKAHKRNGWIITSNHSLEQLTKRFGDDRLGSRLAGMFKFYHITGETDRRFQRENE